MVLVEGIIRLQSFLHVHLNVRGEPPEVQDNVREEPIHFDDDGGSIIGAAV